MLVKDPGTLKSKIFGDPRKSFSYNLFGRFDTINEYREELRSEKLDVAEQLKFELANIEDYNAQLNAFVTIFAEDDSLRLSKVNTSVRNQEEIDALPLFGVPLTVKDNIFIAGYKTTAASAIFQDYVPATNADIVDTAVLAGCVPLGKTNLHELAMGATSSSSFFGPVKNPIDPTRISGGSSGGSAVSVAMSEIPIVSLGTDTGGSVRIPAALCGVCGFKPTFGAISTAGVIPLSATLDHLGILTKNMSDMRVAFDALVGGSMKNEIDAEKSPARKWGIGIPGSYFFEDCVSEVEKSFWNAIDAIRKSDRFTIVENLEIPEVEKINRTRLTIQLSEMFWFYQDIVNNEEMRDLVGKDVLAFFERGSKIGKMEQLISSADRTSIILAMETVLQEVDLIAMPTCLTTAPKIQDVLGKEAGTIRRQLVRNTELFNLCGLPSLTIPSNKFESSGELPTAIEISGRANEDETLLEAGELISQSIYGA